MQVPGNKIWRQIFNPIQAGGGGGHNVPLQIFSLLFSNGLQ